MKVIELGMLSKVHRETKGYPKYGVVIEATRKELKELAKLVKLYGEVDVQPAVRLYRM